MKRCFPKFSEYQRGQNLEHKVTLPIQNNKKMDLFSASPICSRSLARLPALSQIYHQHLVNLIQFSVYATLAFVHIFNMKVYDVTDCIVEHVKARSFLDHVCRFGNINQVENWCQYLIHALDILDSRVELRVDVENASHVIVSISSSLFFFAVQELLVSQLVIPVNQLELLAASTCQVWNHDVAGRCGEERELCMCPRCIFLNLLPKQIILLKLLEPWMVFLQNKWVVRKFRLWQKQLDQSLISFGLILDGLFPQIFFRWQIFQYKFPAIFAYIRSLIRDTFCQAFLESRHIHNTRIQNIDKIGNFFTDYWRHSLSCKPMAFRKWLQFWSRNRRILGCFFSVGHLKPQKIVFHYDACLLQAELNLNKIKSWILS